MVSATVVSKLTVKLLFRFVVSLASGGLGKSKKQRNGTDLAALKP